MVFQDICSHYNLIRNYLWFILVEKVTGTANNIRFMSNIHN